MRKTNKLGTELIKKYEGFIPNVYLDCAGFLTIGYGHLCREGDFYLQNISLKKMKKMYIKNRQEVERITAISKLDAEKILKQDLIIAEQGVCKLIKIHLNTNQFSALVSFVFNLGVGALQRSTLRQKLNRGEYFAVSSEMLKWIYAGGVKRKGLIKRRLEEGILFNRL